MQRGDKISTEQTRSSFTESSPAPGPAGGRASPGLLFCLLPLSTAALGGLAVGGFIFVIAAAALDIGSDSADLTWTGIPASWDRHWAVVTWWTAAIATGWIGIAVLAAGLPDLTPPGGSGLPTLFALLPAGLAVLGATLYAAIAATAVLAVLVPVSAGPGRQEPGRGLAKVVYTLFIGEVTAFITAAVVKTGGNLFLAHGIS